MCRGGILVQGMCFLSATHSFDGKNLYRELEIGGRHVTLLAIQTFVRKRVCRGMRNTPARLNDTTNRPNPARDTGFCAGKGVSRHETWPNDRKTVRDTRFNVEKGVSLQGKVVGKRTATDESGVSRSRSGSGRGQMEAEVGIERSRGRIERSTGWE